MVNKKFSKLTVLRRAKNSTNGSARWDCSCDCGNIVTVSGVDLRTGHTKSCGCFRFEVSRRHGHSTRVRKTSEYRSWQAMIHRVTNPRGKSYRNYGGKGITIDPLWRMDFINFLSDMGTKPSPEYELERLDNSIGYHKNNCVWSTRYEQSRNTTKNQFVTFNGQRLCLTDACTASGVSYGSVRSTRYRQKVNTQTAFNYHLHRLTQSDPQSRLRVVAYVAL